MSVAHNRLSFSFKQGIASFIFASILAYSAPIVAAETQLPPTTAEAAATVPPPKGDYPGSFADLAEKLLPSVVNISTVQLVDVGAPNMDMPQFPPGSPFEDFFKDFMEKQQQGQTNKRHAAALGSGFIIDAAKGYIVTNNHVIQDAEEITVILQDDTNLTAKLVGRDEKTDLALLQVDPKGHKLTAASWGNSESIRVGDWVLAIGNPYGLGGTVTQGIISARARNINSGPYDDYLQTDASINRGNSGGPMFNLNGEVIGINTAIFSPSGGSIGIGFAIPSTIAKNVVDQIIEFGRTKRGWLGVRIQAVTQEIAESLNLGQAHGALVASVSPDSPAAKAGLKTGDIIVSFDGKTVDTMRTLPRIVADTPVGRDVDVQVWREGKTMDVKIKVAELEVAEQEGLVENGAQKTTDAAAPKAQAAVGGLSVSTLTKQLREKYSVDDKTQGVMIVGIDQESKAVDLGVEEGDVIVEADQTEVKTPEAFKEIAAKVKQSGRKSLFLLIQHQGDLRFAALSLEEKTVSKDDKKEKAEANTSPKDSDDSMDSDNGEE